MPSSPLLPQRALLVTLWLLCWFLALGAVNRNGPTFDEQGFLVRGLAYIRGENRHMRVGHPLGLNALNAGLLLADPTVRLPSDDPSWLETSFHRPAELFLWEIGNDVAHIMFLGRLPTIWLAFLLSAFVFRWTRQLTGSRRAALLALTLVAFDPNLLAHAALTTTDFGLAAAALVSGYTLWRYFRQTGWRSAALAGLAFGLLNNTKFTAGLFVPFFAITIAVVWLSEARQQPAGRRWRSWWRRHASFLVLFPLVSFLTLWGMYGFDIGRLPENLPLLPQLGGRTVPLAHHLEQLFDIGGRSTQGAPSFLLGMYADHGWWYYFPVAFLLKTPLPTLILLALAPFAFLFAGRSRFARDRLILLLPPLGYLAVALTSSVNLGYRHLLPILPFLIIFAVDQLWPLLKDRFRGALWPLPAVWMIILAVGIAPHFLSFFNLLAGGPDNGWRWLADSNIDWGQDLPALARWARQNEVEPLWLSYFGEARPEYYGLTAYRGLDSFPPRLMDPRANPIFPANPAPGWYAISATNLQGVHFADHDQFAWFRQREPVAKIGYSIFVYKVETAGPLLAIALGGGLQPHQVPRPVYDGWATNDIRPRWFDPASAWLIPAGPAAQVIVPTGLIETAPGCLAFAPLDGWPGVSAAAAAACAIPADPAGPLFERQAGRLAYLGADLRQVEPGRFALESRWRQLGESRPVTIFIHFEDEAGEIAAQWDGLGVIDGSWQVGDLLYQRHEIVLPDDAPSGRYRVWLGLYDPQSGARWTAGGRDRLPLAELEVGR